MALIDAALARAGDEGYEITFYSRASGARRALASFDLRNADRVAVEKHDLQLNEVRRFRGVSLDWLLQRSPSPRDVDTALLCFRNGMRIPVPLDPVALAAIDAFVATEIGGPDGWEQTFPEIRRRRAWIADPRPIAFARNKVVVSEPGLPRLPAGTAEVFSPWMHADTLVAIELVSREKYEAAFPNGITPEARRGREVFLSRCQYCHGIDGGGAAFGWDFTKPIALYRWRSPSSLWAHVRFQNADAVEKGYLMPPQPDVETSEIDDLWAWMRFVGREP
ncbi:MAG: c-type cytochrome [Deltaproteobacteria bacterium]|nr:c-type cytochrome [Deltaproteobacteria bacterium]